MSEELTKAIEIRLLSADAQRSLQGSGKMVAARGLAPLADARDLLTVLFQLSTDADGPTRAAATKTARGLPEGIVAGALERSDIHQNVLHFFAALVPRDSAAAEKVLLNPISADQTIADLGKRASERECQLISANEERLLRFPKIIGSLYSNTKALQSTVDRAIELAIRNDVRVPGIPNWEELVTELMNSGRAPVSEAELEAEEGEPIERTGLDLMVSRYLNLADDESVANPKAVHDLRVSTQMRIAMIGPSVLRNELLRSRKSAVSMSAISSPKVTEADAAKYAGNLSLGEDVIRYIARRREWTKNYTVKTALVNNPKCPLPNAMKLLPFFRERELKNLARSKNIPSALRAQARKLMAQRGSGSGRGRR